MGHRQEALAAQQAKDATTGSVMFGGSFAPPLTDELVVKYEKLASKAESPVVKDGMEILLRMVTEFRKTPKSKAKGTPHPSGRGVKTPLEAEEIKRIDAVVPWKHELDGLAGVFEGIDNGTQKELRDAAFHLLWYGYELTHDREPCTADML